MGPAVWQLHRYPADYWRPLPDFFLEFAWREGYDIPIDTMYWLVGDTIFPVSQMLRNDEMQLPSVSQAKELWGPIRAVRSRVVHRIFNTYGRPLAFPYIGLGLMIKKSS